MLIPPISPNVLQVKPKPSDASESELRLLNAPATNVNEQRWTGTQGTADKVLDRKGLQPCR